MGKYEVPELNKTSFTCGQCQTYSKHNWGGFHITKNSNQMPFIKSGDIYKIPNFYICICEACGQFSLWLNGKQIYPLVSNIIAPNEDMPKKVKDLYNEARDVYKISIKSSAALLRLGVQILCKELGEQGKNINTDIGNLVKKGLDPSVQKIFDVIRVTGNNAVHPGEIQLDEKPELVAILFEYINIIIDEFYTKPKKIAESYNTLPEGIRKAIEKRDANN